MTWKTFCSLSRHFLPSSTFIYRSYDHGTDKTIWRTGGSLECIAASAVFNSFNLQTPWAVMHLLLLVSATGALHWLLHHHGIMGSPVPNNLLSCWPCNDGPYDGPITPSTLHCWSGLSLVGWRGAACWLVGRQFDNTAVACLLHHLVVELLIGLRTSHYSMSAPPAAMLKEKSYLSDLWKTQNYKYVQNNSTTH